MKTAPVEYELRFLCLEPSLEHRIHGDELFERLKIAAMNEGFSEIQYEWIIHKKDPRTYVPTPGPIKNGKILVVFPIESYLPKTNTKVPLAQQFDDVVEPWMKPKETVRTLSWGQTPIIKEITDMIIDCLHESVKRSGERITPDNFVIDRRAVSLVERKAEIITRANQSRLRILSLKNLVAK